MFKKMILAVAIAAGLNASAHAVVIMQGQLGILDVNGTNPNTGAAWQLGDTYRLTFVTGATTFAADPTIAFYNNFVQTQANAAGLGAATWYAIGSTATVDARDNTLTNPGTHTDSGVMLIDGSTVIADSLADLWDGSMNPNNNRINRTANGNKRQGNFPNTPIWGSWTAVWTGSVGNGTANSPLGGSNVRHGLMQAEPNFWITRSANSSTTYSLPMYAISEVLHVVPEPASMALLGMGGLLIASRRRR